MVEREMIRLRGKYDCAIASELELAMHRITRSLLHTLTLRAQEHARSGDHAGYLAALDTLFGIELSTNGTRGDDTMRVGSQSWAESGSWGESYPAVAASITA